MYYKYVKRFFDFTFALSLCIALSPIFLILMILIHIKLGKPVFFYQERGGLKGRVFKIIKFRTMTDKRDENNNLLPDEVRLTFFGKLLRKLSLDELPSLANVLKGDISFVGPRPFLADYLKLYNDFQIQRQNVLPGITGWAQINGRNAISWEEKFELDVWYVKNQSFALDMKIFFLTCYRLIRPTDISNSNCATMPRFTGTGNSVIDN